MKRLSFVCLLFASSLINAKTFGDIEGVVLRSVYDGDTFKVDIPSWPPIISENISVRIKGIDAPEIRGRCSLEKTRAFDSRNFLLKELERAKVIKLKNIERGKYFRIVSDVFVDNRNVAKLLIDNGYAVSYANRHKLKILCK